MAKTKYAADAAEKVDAYFAGLPGWSRQICNRLRKIVLSSDPSVVEDWKWGPHYQSRGMLCWIGGFKKHVTLTFFQGALLKDPYKVLGTNSGALHNRHIKYTDISQVDEQVLLEYLFEAIDNNAKGLKVSLTDKTVDVPADMKKALKAAGLSAYFNKLSYSHRKEYIQWITSAKREETRHARIGRAIEMLAAKEMMHDKYKNK